MENMSMLVVSAHQSFVGSKNGDLVLVDRDDCDASDPRFADANWLETFETVPLDHGSFGLRDKSGFLCAMPDGRLEYGRTTPGVWETFSYFDPIRLRGLKASYRSPQEEHERFAARVRQLIGEKQPVLIHGGAGPVPREGFLNLDIENACPAFAATSFDEFFIFPFAGMRLDIPDDSVDYVFHEDLIEHLPQTMQWQWMAEMWRVLKPGCWHRVSTPNILSSMKRHSDFKRGSDGVYTGEEQWGHISILSSNMLAEMARTIGYRETVFNLRDGGASQFKVKDLRPSPDRDEHVGNIFADLLK